VWVAEQGSSTAGAYTLAPGSRTATDTPVNVGFPDSPGPHGGPTGQVANMGKGFVLKDGQPAAFIFATIDGRIEAWDPADGITGHAEDKATVKGASYSGLAIAYTTHGDQTLCA
jgi:hypothetical protein